MNDVMETNEIKVNQGLNIKRIRTAKGIKQSSLCEPLGIKTQQGIHDLEKKRIIPDDKLRIIANVLNVDMDILKNMPEDKDKYNIVFEYNTMTNSPIAQNQEIYFTKDMDLVNRLIESEKRVAALETELRMLKGDK
ncbi:MAG: helix-turn-helix domain-containing protein [Tannerella sp.]|jgi:transcriptional regulator with XRE-family HTH domain|nr:helix-turn-helix domain-containing protein [Tannerella sp.]